MDIRIGIINHEREIVVRLPEKTSRAKLKTSIDKAISNETPTLWLTDTKGRQVAIASAKIAFVELGPDGGNPIGFG